MVKDKFLVYFVKEINGIDTYVGKRALSKEKSEVAFKKKTYILDYSKVVYRYKNKVILIQEIDGPQRSLNDPNRKEVVSPELIDVIVRQRMGAQIVQGLNTGMNVPWLWLVVGALIGTPMGWILGQFLRIGR